MALFVGSCKVDLPVDGIGFFPGVIVEDFGGTPGRCHQNGSFSDHRKDIDQRFYDGSFTCSGISAQQEKRIGLTPCNGQKSGQFFQQLLLAGSWFIWELLPE